MAFGNFSTDGIYKSTDGGSTFSKLTSGLPTSGYHRIAMALAPSNPSILYACFTNATTYEALGMYKTTDGGSSWSPVATPMDEEFPGQTHLGKQGWYDNVLAVHPNNPNVVYAGGINLLKSTNGGTSWNNISFGYPPFIHPYVHVDQHAVIFDPTLASTMYFGNDGGVFKSVDGGTTFLESNNGFATVQFYSGAFHPSLEIYYGGAQDNGTLKSLGTPTWDMVFGGDGGVTAVDFSNPNTVYTEYVNLDIQKSTDGGQNWSRAMNGIPTTGSNQSDGTSDRVQFIAPYTMDPSNSQRLAAGTYRVFYTTNAAASWDTISGDLTGDGTGASGSTILAIAIAKTSSSTLYVGTTGSGTSPSKVLVTTNTGSSWSDVTSLPLPNRYVTAVAIDPTTADRALVCYSGYNVNTTATPGHIFLTENRGTIWTNVSGVGSGSLPDIPVNTAIIDPLDSQHFIVGTDLGIFETLNGGINWTQQNSGLANVVVMDLDLRADRMLFAATHGRGMFKTQLGIPNAVDTVYPGDTNADGIVDVRDVLPIGRFFGLTGPARLNASTNWTPQYLTTRWDPPEAADADCNGNGTVEAVDVQVLITNWNRTRNSAPTVTSDPIAAAEEILRAIGTNPSSAAMEAIREEVIRYRSQLLGIGTEWKLEQNYPNPFNPQTTIHYTLPREVSSLSLRIVDVAGRIVREVFQHNVLPGNYSFTWDGRSESGAPAPSGVYFYWLGAGDVQFTRKMILLK